LKIKKKKKKMTDFQRIKQKILADYKFIECDGKILSYFIKELLKNNEDNADKVFQQLEDMSKKQILATLERIMSDFATMDEISCLVKETIDKKKKQIYNLDKEIEESTKKSRSLDEKLQSMIESITLYDDKTLQKTLEFIEKEKILTQNYEQKEFDLTKKLKEKEIVLKQITETLHSFQFSDEYSFDKCDSVLTYESDIYNFGNTHHIHYLDTEKFCPLTLSGDEYNGEASLIQDFYKIFGYGNYKTKISFPISLKLMEDEFFVSVFYSENFIKHTNEGLHNFTIEFEEFVIYITNYGRIIISDKAKFKNIEQEYYSDVRYCSNKYTIRNVLLQSPLHNLNYNYQQEFFRFEQFNEFRKPKKCLGVKKSTPETFPLQIAEPLLYKMPKLFLDVITAFRIQNTTFMQECCKQYFHLTHKDEEKEKIAFSKILGEKENEIREKDKIIADKDKEINTLKEEIEKINLENQKLKNALKAFT
jgi:hypothetical protein